MFDGWDDEQLLDALRQSLAASRDMPPGTIDAAQSAYAWRDVDTELAQLSFDSSRDQELALSRRSETAAVRAFAQLAEQAAAGRVG